MEWGLRSYGAGEGELGSEETMEDYLDNMMKWVKETYRVLKPTGSFILNMGDCFVGSGGGGTTESTMNPNHREAPPRGKDWNAIKGKGTRDWKANCSPTSVARGNLGGIYKTKQLLAVSHFAYCKIITETDFVCRGVHIWVKPNVPSPIRSRLKHSHEYLYWFVKDADEYYFDEKPWMKKMKKIGASQHGNKTPACYEQLGVSPTSCFRKEKRSNDEQLRYMRSKANGSLDYKNNPKSSGECPAGSFHAYVEETIEHSWRVVPVGAKQSGFELAGKQASEHVAPYPENLIRPYIKSLCPDNGIVLDPFLGSGTTMRVALEEGRNCIGIELSEKSIAYCKKRLNWKGGLNIDYEG
jgi:DNA modification methylase